MAILTWILVGLAIADVLFAVVQLFFLSSMKLIVYDMTPLGAWLMAVGPAVFILLWALNILTYSPTEHPNLWLLSIIAGYMALLIWAIFQGAAAKSIVDKRREWDADIAIRNKALRKGS